MVLGDGAGEMVLGRWCRVDGAGEMVLGKLYSGDGAGRWHLGDGALEMVLAR